MTGKREQRVMLEVAIRVCDHPDETGFAHLRERACIAQRELEAQKTRGVVTWRHKVRAAYRMACAQEPDSDALFDALEVLMVEVASWRAAMQRRGGTE